MRYHFVIVGQCDAGDEVDAEEWLKHSINEYNKNPPVVNQFEVFVKEMDREDVDRDFKTQYEVNLKKRGGD